MKPKKVKELIGLTELSDNTIVKIFDVLASKTDLNNFINNTNKDVLNTDYYILHSGEKWLSIIAEKIYEHENENVSTLMTSIANIIYQRYSTKWIKIYDALVTAYKPLENYAMKEKRTPYITHDETIDVKQDITTTRETDSESGIYGFNSKQSSPSNTIGGKETINVVGDNSKNKTHSKRTETGHEDLERSGNIGVTTSQQMLQSEIDLRQYDFYNQIYNDIDTILCLSIY